jgi:hypothetical protein
MDLVPKNHQTEPFCPLPLFHHLDPYAAIWTARDPRPDRKTAIRAPLKAHVKSLKAVTVQPHWTV